MTNSSDSIGLCDVLRKSGDKVDLTSQGTQAAANPTRSLSPTDKEWFAIGRQVAITAEGIPGVNVTDGGVTATTASSWCADIMFLPQPSSLSALILAHVPSPGIEASEWFDGCESVAATEVGTASSPVEATSPAPAETTPPATIEAPQPTEAPQPSPTAPVATALDPTDYEYDYQTAYQETEMDYGDGQTPATYSESNSEYCLTTVEPSLPAISIPTSLVGTSSDPYYAGCMAALKAQH
jgi:hypothetical protein